ncbi:SemiSWEET transporter [Faecalibacter rhinopitheci]|uniref:SemiSWEET transporter n=1 Tax=Faecalibacter rhinopitheci TaxID=2779678 RepID=A0A8J7FT55_9FLAO|nr:SemiSWEET transporter [Faecalibacter rhinopitheci]MBF0596051.1 SemiSWEET transporter [Faecalibacter rhinopitheci]
MELIIGSIAGLLTSVAALPQVIKVFKEKKVENLSLLMISITTLGVFLWVIYGMMKNETPIIISNGVSTFFNTVLLILYFKYKNQKAN